MARKTKPKYTAYCLEIDIYKDAVWLIWPITMKDARSWLNENSGENEPHSKEWEDLEFADAMTTRSEKIGSVIFLTSWKNTTTHQAIVVHEAAHAAKDILQSKGIKIGDETEEVYTYLLEFISQKLLERLSTRTSSKKS